MAKQSLLEIVQAILSDMDSDVVNSIDDTEEATQVAQIVKGTFDAMIANRNWPHTARMINLVPSSDNNFPVYMSFNEDVKEMISIFYDKRRDGDTRLRYEEVVYKQPDDFLRYTNMRDSDSSNTMVVLDPSGVQLLISDNKAPSYYTSFDDQNLIFDSYDIGVDSSLQASKTQARAFVIPEFQMIDEYIPDLPLEAFPALIEEATSKAQFKLRQMNDTKSEQEAQRQQRWLSRKAWQVKGGIKYPDYGRRNRKWYRDPTFRQGDY